MKNYNNIIFAISIVRFKLLANWFTTPFLARRHYKQRNTGEYCTECILEGNEIPCQSSMIGNESGEYSNVYAFPKLCADQRMYFLLVGFITPAVVFAILGFIACWRRNSSVDFKEYESIASTDTESEHPISETWIHFHSGPTYFRGMCKTSYYHVDRIPPPSFSMTFKNKHTLAYELPPSYSEATNLQNSENTNRHLPRESARNHPQSKLRPPSGVQIC